MNDFVLDAPNENRYTYFFAFYGKNFKQKTALLCVQHDFCISARELHCLIRNRIADILGDETISAFHIIALATPDPIPCKA